MSIYRHSPSVSLILNFLFRDFRLFVSEEYFQEMNKSISQSKTSFKNFNLKIPFILIKFSEDKIQKYLYNKNVYLFYWS